MVSEAGTAAHSARWEHRRSTGGAALSAADRQTDWACFVPSTLTAPLHPSSVLPVNPRECAQISSGKAGTATAPQCEETSSVRDYFIALASWRSVPLMWLQVRSVERRSAGGKKSFPHNQASKDNTTSTDIFKIRYWNEQQFPIFLLWILQLELQKSQKVKCFFLVRTR